MRRPRLVDRGRAAFSLIEMLAVLAILSILALFLVSQMGAAEEIVEEKLLRAELEKIGLALAHYEAETGDYPASTFTGDAPGNDLNVGIEALVIALWSDGLDGCGLSADDLANTDGDQSATPLSDLPSRALLEIVDPWGNPLVYFHHADYGRTDRYVAVDAAGFEIDAPVVAAKNPETGLFHRHREFQLLSAGSDGEFGTEDDIANH